MFDSTLNPLWQRYILAVQEEVKPALGCTEPISLALAAAVAAAELEGPVERVEAWVSPNLMKNGLGVTVPGTGMVGLHIGATLEKQCARGLLAKDLSSSIVIRTSAASDARMGGATLPAMSNSGSGNQGITATMPVVVVAEHFGADDERLARALMLSHLSAIYIHNQLPRLSALCAATTAAMGAAAGMAWLVDGRYETISMAISSMIGDVSGMICDGASNSCAMKVSTSASAAWKAVLMALDDTAVTGNEGIVAHDVEQSIANLCALASHSMQQTDRQIIEIMASKAR
ncbi:serine dehydratase subunit alpha family protein [Escherichia coli]|uniref:Putative inner membrane protein n=1 Tax=Escherichia coli TaxID=562 RepID=A0A2Y8JSU2_ECOLX|nr:L-serine ammonia-lyase, iron-sulfur-dependent, subunit alpha [Escherichia coli]EHY6175328.1 serine dehydratase subunit alpha family protein [Escherichia coli]EIB0655842.1 serine dehydratase subunit alpha family protein [Escherichia coli]EKT4866857.1 serine dehydratase subunit alpha family protein [Escherichia coli]MBC1141101.1 serine dehydratase subunit alpha family protein [Escherichia coli]MCZ5380570.1 L-serine ammonia-lyase, iron-sulfur-dependent, subunit alpha [Escherichia coli]